MAHTHPVVDSDSRFVINSTTRVISTTSDKLELIQGDHQSERITFEIPKIVEGHDMSLCDRIEIHYINIDRRTSAISRDVYIADDVAVDGDKLTFSWLISGNATKYYGRLNFIILFECLDPDGNYTYKWNTEICKLLTIGEGISNTSAVIEDHSDILEKFRKEILEEAGEKSIQPDWNQNDETAKDYVKNRPFYTGDTVETVFVEESTVSFADDGYGLYIAEFPSTFEATVGETYKVYWDGATYECTCVNFNDVQVIGNLSIAGVSPDTGEPFVMDVNDERIAIATADTSASHTFSIGGLVTEVVKIDEKYLPDTVVTKSEVEIAKNTANAAQTTANNAQTTANVALERVVEPYTKNAQMAPLYKKGGFSAWRGVVQEIRYDKTEGYFFANAFDTTALKKENMPNGVFCVDVYVENRRATAFLSSLITSRDYWRVHGFAIIIEESSQMGEILCVSSNNILLDSAKGLFLTFRAPSSMLLKSSTANSDKQFRITVDDSGTIRATEVM
jgi:hypothetical protein